MNILESVVFVMVFPFLSFARKYNAFCESYFGGGRAATFFYVCSFPILVLCVYALTIYAAGRAVSCIMAKISSRKRFLGKAAGGTAYGIRAILNGMLSSEKGEISGGMDRSEFWKRLRDIGPESIAIIGHVKPDGDCVAACSSLERYLFHMFPTAEIDIILESTSKNVEKVIPRIAGRKRKHQGKYDIAVILDTDDMRLGEGTEAYKNAEHRFCIDHHKTRTTTRNSTDFCWVEPDAASVCEILYQFYLAGPGRLSPMIARDLFIGIMTDTGGLKYGAVSSNTYRTVADLKEIGVDHEVILRKLFHENPRNILLLTAEAVATSKTYLDGVICMGETNWAMARKLSASVADGGKVPGDLLEDERVLVSVYFFEMQRGLFSVSLRSKGEIDVGKIAKDFNGGGHKNAAGFRFEAEDTVMVRRRLIKKIKESL